MQSFFTRIKQDLNGTTSQIKISNFAMKIILDAYATFVNTALANLKLIKSIFKDDPEIIAIVDKYLEKNPELLA